jgi:polyisoprenoid-binding protein YceI
MRSAVVVGRSMQDRLVRFVLKQKSDARRLYTHHEESPTAFRLVSRLGTRRQPGHRLGGVIYVISEVFRVFQTKLRTSRVSPGYRTPALRIAKQIRGKEAGSKNGGNLLFKKLCNLFEIGALLFTICAAPSTNSAAADHPSNSDEKTAEAPALPTPGSYVIDPDHTFAYFGARHHVVGLVRGRFDKVTGTITVSQDLGACGVDIAIDSSSISTQNTERDEDLRGPAYFAVKEFPTMTYRGRGIRRVSGSSWTMDGSLTIHGVTKVVPLTFRFNGAFTDIKPGKPARVAFHATAATKRADFGIGARDNLAELGTLSTPDVEIQIDVEADAKLPSQWTGRQAKRRTSRSLAGYRGPQPGSQVHYGWQTNQMKERT